VGDEIALTALRTIVGACELAAVGSGPSRCALAHTGLTRTMSTACIRTLLDVAVLSFPALEAAASAIEALTVETGFTQLQITSLAHPIRPALTHTINALSVPGAGTWTLLDLATCALISRTTKALTKNTASPIRAISRASDK